MAIEVELGGSDLAACEPSMDCEGPASVFLVVSSVDFVF